MFQPDPAKRSPERILGYGDAGTGKSTAWISIADRLQKSGSPGQFYVIDTDRTVERVFDEGYDHLYDKVTYFNAFTWEQMQEASKTIANEVKKGDWIVADMIDAPWTEIRNWFIEQKYGTDPELYFMESAQMIKQALDSGKKGHERQYGGLAGTDWDWITKMYLLWEKRLTVSSPAHVFACAPASKVDGRSNDTDDMRTFQGAQNMKPAGQKHLRHRFHTVIYFNRTRTGWEMTCVKDREREEQWLELGGRTKTIEVTDFSSDYLRKLGKWQRERVRRERRAR